MQNYQNKHNQKIIKILINEQDCFKETEMRRNCVYYFTENDIVQEKQNVTGNCKG